MKIIDLLNRIANGEEVPKKIRVSGAWTEGIAFELDDYKHYKHENIDDTYDDLFDDLDNIDLDDFLNTEIIEEDKPKTLNDIRESYGLPRIEDKKIEKLEEKYYYDEPPKIDDMAHKINEIIDYINKGDK